MERMKYLQLLILGVLFSYSSVGQITKIYKGTYKDGFATYEYIDGPKLERVYNGKFEYKNKTGKILVTGHFEKNLKDGLWTYNNTLHKDAYSKSFGKISGHYLNGKMQGEWIFESEVFSISKNRFLFKAKCTANFNQNNFSEKFLYRKYKFDDYLETEDLISIEGQFDKCGFFDSTWMIEHNDIKTVLKFNKGTVGFVSCQDRTTGDVLEYTDSSAALSQYLNLIDSNDFMVQFTDHIVVREINKINPIWNESQENSPSTWGWSALLGDCDYSLGNIHQRYIHNDHFYDGFDQIWCSGNSTSLLGQSISFWIDVQNGHYFVTDRGSLPGLISPNVYLDEISKKRIDNISAFLDKMNQIRTLNCPN
jgi:hypothetical protein